MIQDARRMSSIIRQLQSIARGAGHEHPLMITTDQENGMVLCDMPFPVCPTGFEKASAEPANVGTRLVGKVM